MPRTDVRRRGLLFVAFTVDDFGREHDHRRGITPGHAMNRLVRSFR